MSDTQRRRGQIRDIVERNRVTTQDQLLALLEAEGIQTTQATLSRDLRELGIRKDNRVYRQTVGHAASPRRRRKIGATLRGMLVSAHRSGAMAILHTRPGMAQAVVVELSRGELHEVLGAIAGVDTVFVATATASQARSLVALAGEGD